MFSKLNKSLIEAVNKVLVNEDKDKDDKDDNCVTKPEAKDIAKKEVKGHEKKMHKEDFKNKLLEREMTSGETKKKEEIVMSMKKNQSYFKKKYGARWKEVMYATATKRAMGEELEFTEEEQVEEHTSTDMLRGRVHGVAQSNDFKSFKTRLGSVVVKPETREAPETPAKETHTPKNRPEVAQPKIGVANEEVDEAFNANAALERAKADDKKKAQGYEKVAPYTWRKMKPSQTPAKVKEETEQVEEGWDDMLKDVKAKRGPQPSGGSGVKQGSRYGGGKQKEKPEQEEGGKKKMDEGKRPDTDDTPFDPPYSKQPAQQTDKSGAKHTPMSRVKHLARTAMQKVKKDTLGK